MAITLDTIVNKVFKVVKTGGYDTGEVEGFLDEILEEMEKREAQASQMSEKIAALTQELEQAKKANEQASSYEQEAQQNDLLREQVEALRQELEKTQAELAQRVASAGQQQSRAPESRYAMESYELVLSKAQGVYEETVIAAEQRAEEIINKANDEAVALREKAEKELSDLTGRLTAVRKQASDYCATIKRVMDEQAASMNDLKRML